MNKRNLIIFLVIAPLLAISLAGVKVYHSIQVWRYDGPNVEFQVKPGEGFSKINYRLKKHELISSAKVFHRYAQLNGMMTKLKAGNYIIKTDSNMINVINTLFTGAGVTISITIPEGKNIFEIGKSLESKGITKYSDFIALAKNPDFASELKIPASRVEGYLYPDTYNFVKNTPAKQVIKRMVRHFHKKLNQINFSNAPFSKHSVLTLASIVEKETGASFERPMIAGVFHNRIKKRMRLQSDPTTIYGIYEKYKGNLRKRHLLQKTPYNTYKISGLPIGPISNPGLESIKAVLNPKLHKYIYFVSKNDGTHIFSENYKDHVNAVNKFQKSKKFRKKGRSWRNLKKKQ